MSLRIFLFISLSLWMRGIQAQTFSLIAEGIIASDTTNTNGASWIDIDQDGDLDLFLSNANIPFGFNTAYRNDGNGTWSAWNLGEPTSLQTSTFGHAWGDFNNDGLPDLFLVNAFTQMGSLLYQNLGNGKFLRNERYDIGDNSIKGFHAAWADYDNDGWLDLVILHPARFVGVPITGNFLFHNNGDGGFTRIVNTPITQAIAPFTNATWVDYDRDGDRDLFLGAGPANGTLAPDFLYQNQLKESGKPGFKRISQPVFAKDSLDGQVWNWIDYDQDGKLDAYVTNWGGAKGGMRNRLYHAEDSTWTAVESGSLVEDRAVSLANVWADFDNDSDLDLYVANGASQVNHYYENLGQGNFKKHTEGHFINQPVKTWSATVGDYDNDGDLDLFVANKTGYIQGGAKNHLYRNDLQNGNHWLSIACQGVASNRMGLGAQLYLTATINGKVLTQYREVGANATFLGQNDLRAHFGLGTAPSELSLEIRWPSGQVDTYEALPLDKILTAVEGESLN